MSRHLAQPVNQKKLTNVVVIRLKKAGMRFEVAAYPNKVEEYRQKIEKDLDEVLQVTQVFENVSKGHIAKAADLKKAFGTADVDKVCLVILKEGEVQVNEKERKDDIEKVFKDVAAIIVEKCIHAKTKQALTITVVENAMKEAGVSVVPNKPAKQQALQIIKILQEKSSLPIERAKMRVVVTIDAKKRESVAKFIAEVESEKPSDEGTTVVITGLIEPHNYRDIDQAVKDAKGKVDVLVHSVKPDSDHKFEKDDDDD